MSRQRHIGSGRHMLQLEAVSLGSQDLSPVTINQAQMEQGFVVAMHLVIRKGYELRVAGVTRESNVVGRQECASLGMKESDDIVMVNIPSTASLRESLSRNDNPVVVLIFMGITGNLLTLTADPPVGVIVWITLRVQVQQVLSFDVLDRNGVKVMDFCGHDDI